MERGSLFSPSALGKLLLFAGCALVIFSGSAFAAKHDLKVRNDGRGSFAIETFGFADQGLMTLTVPYFTVVDDNGKEEGDDDVQGESVFLFRKLRTRSEAVQMVQEANAAGKCMWSNVSDIDATLAPTSQPKARDSFIAGSGSLDETNYFPVIVREKVSRGEGLSFTHRFAKGEEGIYVLVFTRCEPSVGRVSFDLNAEFVNPGPNYLSAGDSIVPILLFLFSVAFSALFCFWYRYCAEHKDKVRNVHKLMAMLLIVKSFALLMHAVDMHYLKVKGVVFGWNVIYYIFAFVKGIMFFTVVLLIGSGWSMLKTTLSEGEKKIFLCVIPMQVLANIALIVEEEIAPGSIAWLHWRDILHLVDIACCMAILFPIVWSIRHLKMTADLNDEKTQVNLAKLRQFRSFYLLVVTYIYFTRIIVFLLGATLPFHMSWVETFADQGATLAFFLFTGYRFRPGCDNPYLRLSTLDDDDEDDNDAEFGLNDDDGIAAVEMVSPTLKNRASAAVAPV